MKQEKPQLEYDKKFYDLTDEFRKAVQQSSPEDLDQRIADLTKLESERQNVLKNDPAVATAKEELKNLMTPYRDDTKEFKLQIKFIMWALESKGKA